MKKRVVTISLGLSLLFAPLLLWGQGLGSATAPLKVGVVNFQGAIANTGEGRKAIADLQRKYQPRQQELQRQQQEIQNLQDQLQKQAATLSDDEQRRLSRELEDKQKVFKRATEDFNADVAVDRDDMFQRLSQKMVRVINEYASQNGYALVMDSSQTPIAFVAREVELSEELIKRYDAANPVDAATTPGAGPTTTPAARPAATPPKPAAPSKPADTPKR